MRLKLQPQAWRRRISCSGNVDLFELHNINDASMQPCTRQNTYMVTRRSLRPRLPRRLPPLPPLPLLPRPRPLPPLPAS